MAFLWCRLSFSAFCVSWQVTRASVCAYIRVCRWQRSITCKIWVFWLSTRWYTLIQSPKSIDLDSLIGNSAILLSLWFYVKSILATAVLTILEALSFEFWKKLHLKMLKVPKNYHFRAAWMVKMVDFEPLKSPKLISQSGQKILQIQHCVFPIGLARSVTFILALSKSFDICLVNFPYFAIESLDFNTIFSSSFRRLLDWDENGSCNCFDFQGLKSRDLINFPWIGY